MSDKFIAITLNEIISHTHSSLDMKKEKFHFSLKKSDVSKIVVIVSPDDCTTNPLRQSYPDNRQHPCCSCLQYVLCTVHQAGTSNLSMAYCKRSQFFQNMVKKQSPRKVATTWYRLLISGAANLAAVETHTRMTVMMASMMLMLFPSKTRASWLSSCTVCCCCCCWSSSLDTRVWHDSRASWDIRGESLDVLIVSQVAEEHFADFLIPNSLTGLIMYQQSNVRHDIILLMHFQPYLYDPN